MTAPSGEHWAACWLEPSIRPRARLRKSLQRSRRMRRSREMWPATWTMKGVLPAGASRHCGAGRTTPFCCAKLVQTRVSRMSKSSQVTESLPGPRPRCSTPKYFRIRNICDRTALSPPTCISVVACIPARAVPSTLFKSRHWSVLSCGAASSQSAPWSGPDHFRLNCRCALSGNHHEQRFRYDHCAARSRPCRGSRNLYRGSRESGSQGHPRGFGQARRRRTRYALCEHARTTILRRPTGLYCVRVFGRRYGRGSVGTPRAPDRSAFEAGVHACTRLERRRRAPCLSAPSSRGPREWLVLKPGTGLRRYTGGNGWSALAGAKARRTSSCAALRTAKRTGRAPSCREGPRAAGEGQAIQGRLEAWHADTAVRRAWSGRLCGSADRFICQNLSVAGYVAVAGLCRVRGRVCGPFPGRFLENCRRCIDGAVERLLGCSPAARDRCGHRLWTVATCGRKRFGGRTRAYPRHQCRYVRTGNPARLCTEPHNIDYAAQTGPHTLVHIAACLLGGRRVRGALLPTRFPERHRHHPFCAVGHPAGLP